MSSPRTLKKTIYTIRLKVGDTVVVRTGKYKGRTGKISALHPSLNKVTVDGINIVKRHIKPTTKNPQGGIIEITKPVNVSKVGYYDATAKKAVRLGFKLGKDNAKIRVNLKSGKELK